MMAIFLFISTINFYQTKCFKAYKLLLDGFPPHEHRFCVGSLYVVLECANILVLIAVYWLALRMQWILIITKS